MINRKILRQTALVTCLLVLASGCAGPRVPVAVGVKEFPSDVLLGDQSNASATVPSAQPAPPQRAPVRTQSGAAPAGPEEIAVEVDCPRAGPFDFAKREARGRVDAVPVEATYAFRPGLWVNDGTLEAPAETTEPTVARRVHDVEVDDDPDAFTFEVTDEGDGITITTAYEVVQSSVSDELPVPVEPVSPPSEVEGEEIPDAGAPPGPAVPDQGLFLTALTLTLDDGSTTHLAPEVPLVVAPLPLQGGTEFLTAGYDPLTMTAMYLRVKVGMEIPDPDDPEGTRLASRANVDACGNVLQGWYIDISEAMISGPTVNAAFSSLRVIAPQFGGISILETLSLTGSIDGTDVELDREHTITDEPAVPS